MPQADEEIAVVSTAEQQKVELPVVGHEACAETWSGVGINITAELSLETHLCAGGEEGKDACKVTGEGVDSAVKRSIFSRLKVPTIALSHLRHYDKQTLTLT